MIDFFHKGAEMTKRITGVARLKGAPVIHPRKARRLTHIATFYDGEDAVAKVLLEVADTEWARRRGLMGRKEIPEITGMLFDGLSGGGFFWMKGCEVPIDVVFVDSDGVITKTYSMDVDGGRGRYGYDDEDVSAIELSGGYVKRRSIKKGQRVSIARIRRPDLTGSDAKEQ